MILSPLENLPNEVIECIASSLNASDILRLNRTSLKLAAKVAPLFFSLYKDIFGIIDNQPKDMIIARLLCTEKEPKRLFAPTVNEELKASGILNSIPRKDLESWKRLLKVENLLDAEIRPCKRTERKTTVSNILDKEVEILYNEIIQTLRKTRATSITQLKNQLQGFWYIDRVKSGIQLNTLSENTSATIGGFTVGDKSYDRVFILCMFWP